jgi:hypothetical protein
MQIAFASNQSNSLAGFWSMDRGMESGDARPAPAPACAPAREVCGVCCRPGGLARQVLVSGPGARSGSDGWSWASRDRQIFRGLDFGGNGGLRLLSAENYILTVNDLTTKEQRHKDF